MKFENFLNLNHLVKDFFVILPLIKIVGIFFCFKFTIVLGQISESINNAIDGFQYSIKSLIIFVLSIGKIDELFF